jgi:hypothetical protein
VTPSVLIVREEELVMRSGVAPSTAVKVMFPDTPVEEQILLVLRLLAKVTVTFPIVGREARADSNAREVAEAEIEDVVAPRNFSKKEPPLAVHVNS